MNDTLSRPASQVLTPASFALDETHEPFLFFDGDRFVNYIAKRKYDRLDVSTYSITKAFDGLPFAVYRLIYGIRQQRTSARAMYTKFVMNNHTKLFIGYLGKHKEIFLGSQNLTYGTNLNIMYMVRKRHHAPLVDFFEKLWTS